MAERACHVFGSATQVGLTQGGYTVVVNDFSVGCNAIVYPTVLPSSPSPLRQLLGFLVSWLVAFGQLWRPLGMPMFWPSRMGFRGSSSRHCQCGPRLRPKQLPRESPGAPSRVCPRLVRPLLLSSRATGSLRITIHSTRTYFAPPNIGQIKLALCLAPLRRSG